MKNNLFRLVALLSALLVYASTQTVRSSETQDVPTVGFISVEELQVKLSSSVKVTIIDVRSSNGYSGSTERIKGAIHVKLRRLRSRLGLPPLKEIPRDQEVVTYCACPNDESSIEAARILQESGFKRARALKGGWQEWKKAGGPTESKPRS